MKRLEKDIKILKGGRGRKPKRNLLKYAFLIALKEFDKRTLRGAEMHLSRFVFDERVDHSVIAYWEKNPKMCILISQFIAVAGAMLDKVLSTEFTFVDATKFTSWHIEEVMIHVANRIAKETVYPIGISFKTKTVSEPVNECLPKGNKILYADAGYDDNKTIGVMFKKGYVPVVCPNKNRWKGHFRRRARKVYNQPIHRLGYRQRGRGESMFGSLTNCYGDRLHARIKQAMITRISARVLCYQIKLLIRTQTGELVLIIRHAHNSEKFIYLKYF